ncbi:uncharacterized protein LOC129729107 [Wyeomyia smithii]|uniref:uncharacterized protein LOC129729107 n=1 Tax=Wyeomyia smithii TaxID=174621 RepID=UPI002467B6F3|nr:uncharacterized protein LOC129729107 [Wyeomyia smithii]
MARVFPPSSKIDDPRYVPDIQQRVALTTTRAAFSSLNLNNSRRFNEDGEGVYTLVEGEYFQNSMTAQHARIVSHFQGMARHRTDSVEDAQSKETVNLYFQNVRGHRTKIDEILLSVSSCEYDAIMLVETNLTDSITSEQLFGDDYIVYRADRSLINSKKRSGGGVLIAVHCKHASSCIDSEEEYETIIVRVALVELDLFLVAGYIPPDVCNNAAFVQNFAESIRKPLECAKIDDNILVCGDFNQATIAWKMTEACAVVTNQDGVSSASAALLDCMATMNLHQYNIISNPRGNILDLAFCNLEQCTVVEAAVPLVKIDAPHPPLDITLKGISGIPLCSYDDTPRLDFKRIDFNALKVFLAAYNWSSVFSRADVDDAVSRFVEVLLQWLNSNVPVQRKPRKPPWENRSLQVLKREMKACQRHYRKTRTPLSRCSFKQASQLYRRLNTRLYKQYVTNTQINLRRNPKSFWQFVRTKRRNNNGIPAKVFLDDKSTMDPLIKCELFADHFSTVFNTTTATADEAALAASDIPINMISADVPEITEEALLKAAKRLKTSNAPGPDDCNMDQCMLLTKKQLKLIDETSFDIDSTIIIIIIIIKQFARNR